MNGRDDRERRSKVLRLWMGFMARYIPNVDRRPMSLATMIDVIFGKPRLPWSNRQRAKIPIWVTLADYVAFIVVNQSFIICIVGRGRMRIASTLSGSIARSVRQRCGCGTRPVI